MWPHEPPLPHLEVDTCHSEEEHKIEEHIIVDVDELIAGLLGVDRAEDEPIGGVEQLLDNVFARCCALHQRC